jgi:hypothetical protein
MKWLAVAGMLVLAGALVRFVVFPSRVAADESEPYRVEMVHNDPYKVQMGLNSMAKQGWYYVSGITRSDGKILLVFRKAG